jgi:hypothetical protein
VDIITGYHLVWRKTIIYNFFKNVGNTKEEAINLLVNGSFSNKDPLNCL